MKKRILPLVCVVVLCVLLAPFPTRVNTTLPGVRMTTAGEEVEAVNIQVQGWKLHYLVRQNQLQYTIKVSPFAGEEDNVAVYTGIAPIKAGNNYLLNQRDTANAEENFIAIAVIAFTEGFNDIRIDDAEDNGYSYIATTHSDMRAKEVYDSFPISHMKIS